ncbi:1-phosphofructokinase family hexose kinase [Streptomyces sp. CC208A]|uniref:1-phosphofructokinase family hexose kinase n=1 Tax=Streptomyces sp. CC208A TaxID=3044573 RepID=UPI0024A85DB4|nr:1-phosphofructokinase family hexose kinase [Streptomyces sp. CC208A]
MIVTVTLNAALDITHRVDRLRPHSAHRVRAVGARAGGKGVNVSRVLHALGLPTLVTGLAGGPTGEAVRRELREAELPERLTRIDGETRRTVAVVDEHTGDTTTLLEPGPVVRPDEWRSFLTDFDTCVDRASAVVLSGSLPPGLPEDAYATLVRAARARGVPAILDTSGPALRAALAAGPALVKPNADELAEATGEPDPPPASGRGYPRLALLGAAEALRAAGAEAVVASLGPDGLLAVTPSGAWRAAPPERLRGNPTGAGDAAVAALARGLTAGVSWPRRLADAVALSAAAVAAPLAGSYDPTVHRRLRGAVDVHPLS